MAFTGGPRSGTSSFTMVSGSGLSLTSVRDGAGQVIGGQLGNTNSTPVFVKLYDISAAQVAGSSSGLSGASPVKNLIVPGATGGGGSNFGPGTSTPFAGMQFANGLAVQITTNIALTDASGIQAGTACVNLDIVP